MSEKIVYLFIYYIYTDNWGLKVPYYTKHNLSGNYPYHKVPDMKHFERYRVLKALKINQILHADWVNN